MKNEDFLPLNKMTKEEQQMALHLRNAAIIRFDIALNNIILKKYNKNTNMQITFLILLLQYKIFNGIKEIYIEERISNKKYFIHLINQHIFKICYDYLNITSIRKIGIEFKNLQTQEFLEKLNNLTLVTAAEIYYKIDKDYTKSKSSKILNLEMLDSYLEADLSLVKDNLFEFVQNTDLLDNKLMPNQKRNAYTNYILFFIFITILILITTLHK